MKRTLLAVLALAASVPAWAAERRYTVTDFDRVQVEGPFVVTLATGKSPSAMVAADGNGADIVSIDVQGKTLRIRRNRSAWGGYPGEQAGSLKIVLSTHELRGVTVTGSGSISIDKAKAMRVDVGLSGSGRVSLGRVEADVVSIGQLGSGRILIGGTARTLHATIQGNGDLDAGALSVDDADVRADTAGLIGLAVNRAVKIVATGPGDVTITGKPACTVSGPGSANVRCGN